MSLDRNLERVASRHQELAALMSGPSLAADDYARYAKEYAELTPVAEAIETVKHSQVERDGLLELLADAGTDAEMRELVQADLSALETRLPELEHQILLALLPRDAADEKNAILEVRAGTGGDEAGLFAGDLFAMYQKYASLHGWRFEVMELSTGDVGFKEATASITGRNVFARLKFESGVHRVQRVPSTETQGRIHTSTATIAVLPEAEEVDIAIADKDIRIDVFRSSGPGGQSVNTTDSAVRITHLPTGIVVSQQDEKSQHKNKAKALKILRARIYDAERSRVDAERSAARRGQVGTGDRSERIRTYNFPQGRVSDHRINLTLYKIDKVMTGEALDEFVDALTQADQAEKLGMINSA